MKKNPPEHKYSVTFVTKVGAKTKQHVYHISVLNVGPPLKSEEKMFA